MSVTSLGNCTFDIRVLFDQERVCTIGFEAPRRLKLDVPTYWGGWIRPIVRILHSTRPEPESAESMPHLYPRDYVKNTGDLLILNVNAYCKGRLPKQCKC